MPDEDDQRVMFEGFDDDEDSISYSDSSPSSTEKPESFDEMVRRKVNNNLKGLFEGNA